jgi:hypothetical protein
MWMTLSISGGMGDVVVGEHVDIIPHLNDAQSLRGAPLADERPVDDFGALGCHFLPTTVTLKHLAPFSLQ